MFLYLLAIVLLSNIFNCDAGDLHNLIYWTPHKTGSTSMRQWLHDITSLNGFPDFIGAGYYPYAKQMDWYDRSTRNGKLQNCTLISGHIYVRRLDERRKEGDLGRVVTTTRDVVDTFLSKYFHRTRSTFSEKIYSKGEQREDLLRYFDGLDPCETLRYYDGLEGCNLEHGNLLKRVERIVERIDCVVDTNDPQEDVHRLCVMMQVRRCATFGYEKSKGEGRYARIKEDREMRRAIESALKAASLLRQTLLKKKCRDLKTEQSTRWPFPGCASM